MQWHMWYVRIKVDFTYFTRGRTNLYQCVQKKGLQSWYTDPEDSSIRDAVHLFVALAFLLSELIESSFDSLASIMPEDFLDIYKYFGKMYVRGSRARGKIHECKPLYSRLLRSQYHSVLQGTTSMNNILEGWQNHLSVIIGKDHSGFYTFLVDLAKEQADSRLCCGNYS